MDIFVRIRSFIINLKIFGFKIALKNPILYALNVKIKGLYKNCIIMNCNELKHGMIKLGFENKYFDNEKYNTLIFNKGSKLIINGSINIASGFYIYIDKSSFLIINDGFISNSNCYIKCIGRIEICENVIFDNNVYIINNDYHLYTLNKKIKIKNHIKIEKNVLVGSNSHLINKAYIPKNSIILNNSMIDNKLYESNVVYGGNPVRIIKKEISWKKEE